MPDQHYIFFTRKDQKGLIVPQSLDVPDCNIVIKSLLDQGFNISPIYVISKTSRDALKKYAHST